MQPVLVKQVRDLQLLQVLNFINTTVLGDYDAFVDTGERLESMIQVVIIYDQYIWLSPRTGTLLAKKENSPLSKRFPSSSVT